MTFNMAVGNAGRARQELLRPARARHPGHQPRPLYDVLSTIALELTDRAGQPMQADTHLAQRVGGQADIRKVTAADLVDEAATWGIRPRAASAVVAETLDQVLAAIAATPGDARVLAVIREQVERVSLR
jgi:serine/threonine-protein kinase HipA